MLGALLAAFVSPASAQPFSPPHAVPSPDGTILATGHWDGTLKLIDAAKGKELFTLQKGIGKKMAEISAQIWLPTITFSPDGKLLASHRANEQVHVWDVAKGKEVATLQHHGDVMSFSSDAKMIAIYVGSRTGGTVRIWDIATKKERFAVETKERVKAMSFSANGKMLVTTSILNEGKLTAIVWDVETATERSSLSGTSAQVGGGGRTLVVVTTEGRASFLDLNTGKNRTVLDLDTPEK
jgi:WD40 repeat protein